MSKYKMMDGTIKGGVDSDGQPHLSKDANAKEAEREVKKWLQKIKLVD
jgi:hypothetical protein